MTTIARQPMRDRGPPTFARLIAEQLACSADEVLWAMVYAAFAHHMKDGVDKTPSDALNRVAQKDKSRAPACRLSPETCDVRSVIFYPESAVMSKHRRHHPFVVNLPVVILELGETTHLLDGGTRTNAWRSLARNEPQKDVTFEDVGLEAIVITPRGR